MQIDKAAANRFISAAISSSRAAVDPNYTPVDLDADLDTEAAAAGPSGTHTRFTDAEKEDLDRLLEDKDGDDVSDDEDAEDTLVEEMLRGARSGLQAAQKARQSVETAGASPSSGAGKKNKRKSIDPFAGTRGDSHSCLV